MPEGVIMGGWAYVIAAYSITAVAFALFAWWLIRCRSEISLREDPRREI